MGTFGGPQLGGAGWRELLVGRAARAGMAARGDAPRAAGGVRRCSDVDETHTRNAAEGECRRRLCGRRKHGRCAGRCEAPVVVAECLVATIACRVSNVRAIRAVAVECVLRARVIGELRNERGPRALYGCISDQRSAARAM